MWCDKSACCCGKHFRNRLLFLKKIKKFQKKPFRKHFHTLIIILVVLCEIVKKKKTTTVAMKVMVKLMTMGEKPVLPEKNQHVRRFIINGEVHLTFEWADHTFNYKCMQFFRTKSTSSYPLHLYVRFRAIL